TSFSPAATASGSTTTPTTRSSPARMPPRPRSGSPARAWRRRAPDAAAAEAACRSLIRAARSVTDTIEAVEHDRTLSQIAQGLTWIGAAFLVASGAVIVWAVFRTVGVNDLLVALTVAGLGLGLPAIVAFVVAWILNSLGHADVEIDDDAPVSDAASSQRPALTNVAWAYAVAVLVCVAAWGVRVLLDRLLGQQVTYGPLRLSVAFAAWYGGLGRAALATLLGAGISWYAYMSPRDRF